MITNRATHVVAATLGVLVGLAGVNHGIFEIPFNYLNTVALWMVALMTLSAITAFAHDIQVQGTKESPGYG